MANYYKAIVSPVLLLYHLESDIYKEALKI